MDEMDPAPGGWVQTNSFREPLALSCARVEGPFTGEGSGNGSGKTGRIHGLHMNWAGGEDPRRDSVEEEALR